MARTVQFSEYGGTDVLAAVDAPALTAGPGQVRIEVRAAGINPIDWKIMRGFMREMIPLTLPAGLGSDVAGVVDQVGTGDRKSTRLNSSHLGISYAVFCLKKKELQPS